MIDRNHDLSISRQAQILGISRGSVYYLPRPTPAADLALMRRIDELHLDYPFAGSRMLQGLLNADGHDVGRLHVRTLIITGLTTDRCVLFTASDAHMRDLHLVVPEDCCAAQTPAQHKQAIEMIERVLEADTTPSGKIDFKRLAEASSRE